MTIETKYNIGDKVWQMRDNEPTQFTIDRMRVLATNLSDAIYIYYEVVGSSKEYYESELFPTKQALLDSL